MVSERFFRKIAPVGEWRPYPVLPLLAFSVGNGEENHPKAKDFLPRPNPKNPWKRRGKRSESQEFLAREKHPKGPTKPQFFVGSCEGYHSFQDHYIFNSKTIFM